MINLSRQLKVLVMILAFTTLSFFTTSVVAKDNDQSAESTTLNIPVKDIQRFTTVIAQIKRYYIKDTTDKELFNNAIRGMLMNLDPHSSFLDSEDLNDLETITTGEFGGIGVEIVPENGFIKVISPLDDTPAFKAGIKSGDMIVRINNEVIKKMTVREAINKIRGKHGSVVTLTILRKGEKSPLNIDVTREVIKIDSVKSRMLEDGYGYVRIVFFQAPAKDDLDTAIKKLQKDSNGKLKGLVLDLRNNPGGLLDAAIHIADTFLDAKKLSYNKLIVYTKGRIPGSDIQAKATSDDMIHGIPMVVLINGGSASASEIVAGALQDYKRAVVMGTKSFGKGSVQTIIPIDATSGIKLTTALYYTPAGRSIQAAGIVPDITVPELKVTKEDDAETKLESIDEADLSGHLENANAKKTDEKTDNAKKVEKKDKDKGEKDKKDTSSVSGVDDNTAKGDDLAYKDYQLFSALNLLKGLAAAK